MLNQLGKITQAQLNNWIIQAKEKAQLGQLPEYIPLLQQADRNSLDIYILSLDGQVISTGNLERTFPLMSVIKPLLLHYLLSYLGKDTVFQRVGKEPSDYPFNSLTQLQIDRGFPRNPMINSGAILLSSLLPGEDAFSRCETLRQWLNDRGCHLFLTQSMLESVRSLPNMRNLALVQEMAARGYLQNPEIALDTYNHICCLSGNIIDLARLGLLLQTEDGYIVQDIMTTCGLYEASADFAQTVGLPTKSGVSGTVLSVVPHQGAIACYSPPLDRQSNPIAGLFLVEQIAKRLRMAEGSET